MTPTAGMNDQAFAELCWLAEQADTRLAPDAIWLSGKPHHFQHLRDLGALSLSNDLAGSITCDYCCDETYHPVANPDPQQTEFPYRGYCPECGWRPLKPEQARYWQVHPTLIARWLSSALQLTPRYSVESVIDGVLWRLGEIEHRRNRHTLFFGCQLAKPAAVIEKKLNDLVAPGSEILITTSDTSSLRTSALASRQLIPLRAIAHLRKAGLVIENLDAYLSGIRPVESSDETSLRLMHTKRVALINGEQIKLSPQVYDFLKLLEDADGDEVHKSHIASAMNISSAFRRADIFKRHKNIFDTFAQADNKGNYWLHPDFIILERG